MVCNTRSSCISVSSNSKTSQIKYVELKVIRLRKKIKDRKSFFSAVCAPLVSECLFGTKRRKQMEQKRNNWFHFSSPQVFYSRIFLLHIETEEFAKESPVKPLFIFIFLFLKEEIPLQGA